ncbi:MAG: type II secretion system F family protein [Candidatus Kaelpia aquatica]|nr:type II secretion system F family protein [Candidatus Kaelpia aquatica]
MATYIYRCRTPKGGIEKGSLDAADKDKAVGHLQDRGLVIVSLKANVELLKTKQTSRTKRFRIRVKIDDLASLARQLATLLDAGVPLLRCLEIVRDQVEVKSLYNALEKANKDVEAGEALSAALAKHPKIFTDFWVNLISTGETSGQLPLVLMQLCEYMESTAALQRKMISALIYPILLSVASTAALIVFLTIVVPMFTQLYSYFDADLPMLTQGIMVASDIMKKWTPLLLIMFGGFVFFIIKFKASEKGEVLFDRLKIKVPVLSALFFNIILYRFSSGLSMLLKSGVPILYSLEVVSKAVANKIYEGIIVQAKDKVREGGSLGSILELYYQEFPPFVTNMVKIGEESGSLPNMLGHLADYYQEKVETIVERLPFIVEPAIILTVGGVIGIIVVGMFLPIFGLATAVDM